MDNNFEQERVKAEEGRVEAEAGRAHAESNDGSGRVEQELVRQEEFEKFLADPQHYTTPGAKRYFRRVWIGYAILTAAIVLGLYLDNKDTNNSISAINNSRATITYTTCLDTNSRHNNTVEKLDTLLAKRRHELRELIMATDDEAEQARYRSQIDQLETNRSSTVGLIDALAPLQNCEQVAIDRFGYVPDLNN